MIGPWLSGAIAAGAPVGSHPAAGVRGQIIVAIVVVAGVFAYTWVASRLVKMPSATLRPTGGAEGAGGAEPSEPEPLVDGLLRDAEAALRDRGLVREARRRVLLSRRSPRADPQEPSR